MFEIRTPEDLLRYKVILENDRHDGVADAVLTGNIDMTGIDRSPILFEIQPGKIRDTPEGNGYSITGLKAENINVFGQNESFIELPFATDRVVYRTAIRDGPLQTQAERGYHRAALCRGSRKQNSEPYGSRQADDRRTQP